MLKISSNKTHLHQQVIHWQFWIEASYEYKINQDKKVVSATEAT